MSELKYEKPSGRCALPLDKNENLLVPKEFIEELVSRAVSEADPRLYPAPELEAELEEALAKRRSVDPDMVVVTSGADEAISLLLDAVKLASRNPSPLSVSLKPSYSVYVSLSRVKGFRVEFVDIEEETFRIEAEDLAEKASRADVVLLCDPNNPTGNRLGSEVVRSAVENAGGLVVVDETYLMFADDSRSIAGSSENLAVVGSFSKTFGLAGLRLGYVIAEPHLAGLLKTLRLPYQVNSIALRAGLLALTLSKYFEECVERARRIRRALVARLSEVPELRVYDTQTNFILAKAAVSAKRLSEETSMRGVCIRAYEGLFRRGDSYIRISLPPENLLGYVESVIRDGVEAAKSSY
ncbi:MAG: histidinol-phosphate transaminase [Acidilobaceae archaeon]